MVDIGSHNGRFHQDSRRIKGVPFDNIVPDSKPRRRVPGPAPLPMGDRGLNVLPGDVDTVPYSMLAGYDCDLP